MEGDRVKPEQRVEFVEAQERAERIKRGLPPDHLLNLSEFPFAFAFDAVKAFIQSAVEWQAKEPRNPNALVFRAWAAFAQRDYALANKIMDVVQSLCPSEGMARVHFGVAPEVTTVSLPAVSGEYLTDPGFFLCCD